MVEDTADRIKSGVTTLFEATFKANNLYVKVDILKKMPATDRWHLIEVKSTKRVKKEHLQDVSIQSKVVEASGIDVERVSILHLNGEYQHPEKGELFLLSDVTEKGAENGMLFEQADELLQVLKRAAAPDIPLGRYCLRPKKCPFFQHCWEGIKQPHIYDINNLHTKREKELRDQSIFFIDDIPADFPLTPRQRTQVNRIQTKAIEIDREGIKGKLDQLNFPLYFFDFETINPALPWIDDTSPFDHLPFQYSLHTLQADGSLSHVDFLHTDRTDPHPELAASILEEIGPTGSIVVYHADFEKRVLRKLAERFPALADALNDRVDRIWDLEKIFLEDYFHYKFRGKSSIKVILPILVPRLSYDGLAVQNGAMAQIVWLEMIDTRPGPEKEALITNLKTYCWQDTLAMVEIYRVLNRL